MASPDFNQLSILDLGTAFQEAVLRGHEQIVGRLIASPRFEDLLLDDLLEALRIAIRNSSQIIIDQIVDSRRLIDIDVDALFRKNIEELPPNPGFNQLDPNALGEAFLDAVRSGSIESARPFLKNHLLNKMNIFHFSEALAYASANGFEEIVLCLIECPKAMELDPTDLGLCVRLAATCFQENCLQILTRYHHFDEISLDDFTSALTGCCETGSNDCFLWLKQLPQFYEITPAQLSTVLHSASAYGYPIILREIINASRMSEIDSGDLSRSFRDANRAAILQIPQAYANAFSEFLSSPEVVARLTRDDLLHVKSKAEQMGCEPIARRIDAILQRMPH
jgi:hypothetical protein